MVTIQGTVKERLLVEEEGSEPTVKLVVQHSPTQLFHCHGLPKDQKIKVGDRVKLEVNVALETYRVTKI
jgi:hypothetical protein